jgi:hypothetical protein
MEETTLRQRHRADNESINVYRVKLAVIKIYKYSVLYLQTIITRTSIDFGSIPKPIVGLTLKADTIQWAGRSGTGTVKR